MEQNENVNVNEVVEDVAANTAVTAEVAGEVKEVKAPSILKQLMDDAGIKTFVPLAKAVGVAPQQLYSRKAKDGTYKYDSIETYLKKNSNDGEGNPLTIEAIVEKAKAGLVEKVAKTEKKAGEKKETKAKKEQAKVEKIKIFTEGSKVQYQTYRVYEGVREDYTVTATIKTVGEEQIILIRDTDGAESSMSKSTASKKLSLVTEAPEEVIADVELANAETVVDETAETTEA